MTCHTIGSLFLTIGALMLITPHNLQSSPMRCPNTTLSHWSKIALHLGGGPIQAACLQLVTHCVNHSRHRCCFDLIGVPDDTVLLFSRQSPSMQLCARCVLLMDCKHRTHFIRSLMELTLLKKDGSALSRRSQLMLQTLLSADDTPDKMSGYRSRDN